MALGSADNPHGPGGPGRPVNRHLLPPVGTRVREPAQEVHETLKHTA